MICCKSYQDIPEDPRYAGPDTEDYFDMFLTAWCKANGVKDVNNKDYEIIKRYWYEFENGNGEEPDHNSDMTLEEMNAELKEYDENREKHTCETCERKRDEIFCSHCRTGCNDDYTLSDYWHSYTRVEKQLWKRIAQLQNDKGELVDKCKGLEKENAELQDKLKNLASVAEVRLANWQKYEKENVELKESITKFSKNGLDFLHSMKSNRNCIDCESKMSIQLIKAKELLKRCYDNYIHLEPLRSEIEQFLDSEVKNALS